MNKVGRRLAEIPAGSWTKWIVVGFWLVVLVIALPLSGKLMGAEKNNASAWLPAGADPAEAGERSRVGGRLGPVRRGQARSAVIDNDRGEDVGRLAVSLHVEDLGRLGAGRQPGTRVVLLRPHELPRQWQGDHEHDQPEAHDDPLGPAPGRDLSKPSRYLVHRFPRVPVPDS